MRPLSDDEVVKLLPALAEAARADRRTAERFIPPRTGILEETAARHHQFVFGRRGVGKSTLLRKIESLGPDGHGDVIFVDIETLRGRPYPDVLIELLIELLGALERRLRGKARWIDFNRSRRRAGKRVAGLRRTLRRLLNEPQTAERLIRDLQATGSATESGLAVEGTFKRIIKFKGSATSGHSATREETRESRVQESKMDGLLGAAILIRSALAAAQEHLEERTMLVVLDDFYHVPYDAQPEVLAYLHQVVKNLGIYLKICGVRHRINPFLEGDPPHGLQIGQDAGEVSLDITLERFTSAQDFLEEVLQGICEPLDVKIDDLVSEGGRLRLVLGSGGVARDYLYLTQKALRNANERKANPTRLHNRVGGEDVNEAAAALMAQKQQDLQLDVGKDADRLRGRLDDLVNFCLDVNKTNIFLVEGPLLQEREWGKEIQALADLRLVHEIGNLSVQTGSYRGRNFIGFTLDLSNYTGTRSERIKQIDFWTPAGRQAIRRAGLIYTPGAAAQSPAAPPNGPTATPDWGEQLDISSLEPKTEVAREQDQSSGSSSESS